MFHPKEQANSSVISVIKSRQSRHVDIESQEPIEKKNFVMSVFISGLILGVVREVILNRLEQNQSISKLTITDRMVIALVMGLLMCLLSGTGSKAYNALTRHGFFQQQNNGIDDEEPAPQSQFKLD